MDRRGSHNKAITVEPCGKGIIDSINSCAPCTNHPPTSQSTLTRRIDHIECRYKVCSALAGFLSNKIEAAAASVVAGHSSGKGEDLRISAIPGMSNAACQSTSTAE